MKLQSSMTLFALVAGRGSVFERVLEKHYQGKEGRQDAADTGNSRVR